MMQVNPRLLMTSHKKDIIITKAIIIIIKIIMQIIMEIINKVQAKIIEVVRKPPNCP